MKVLTIVDVVLSGIAFHHGGLSYADRNNVEKAFMNGVISVVCRVFLQMRKEI